MSPPTRPRAATRASRPASGTPRPPAPARPSASGAEHPEASAHPSAIASEHPEASAHSSASGAEHPAASAHRAAAVDAGPAVWSAHRGVVLSRDFYRRDSRVVAPELLGKVLWSGDRAGRIVEVEAYCGSIDPGAHSYRGRTARNAVMFGPPGHLYVYFTYGMHWCANAVCGDQGEGVAVLIRALEPLAGVAAMRTARGATARRDIDLCSGPAKLTRALGIDGADNGADLVSGVQHIVITDDGTPPPARPVRARRVGLSAGAEHPWRWYVGGNPHVSRP